MENARNAACLLFCFFGFFYRSAACHFIILSFFFALFLRSIRVLKIGGG